jgi:F-type H+-transporting ATPase subunit b
MKNGGINKNKFKFVYPVAIAGFLLAMAGIAWASSGGDADGGVHNSWLKVDTWKVVNFGILAAIGFFLLKKPVAEFFSSRKKGIEDEINELEQKKSRCAKKTFRIPS